MIIRRLTVAISVGGLMVAMMLTLTSDGSSSEPGAQSEASVVPDASEARPAPSATGDIIESLDPKSDHS